MCRKDLAPKYQLLSQVSAQLYEHLLDCFLYEKYVEWSCTKVYFLTFGSAQMYWFWLTIFKNFLFFANRDEIRHLCRTKPHIWLVCADFLNFRQILVKIQMSPQLLHLHLDLDFNKYVSTSFFPLHFSLINIFASCLRINLDSTTTLNSFFDWSFSMFFQKRFAK